MVRDFQNFVGLGPVRNLKIFIGPGPVPGFEIFPGPVPNTGISNFRIDEENNLNYQSRVSESLFK